MRNIIVLASKWSNMTQRSRCEHDQQDDTKNFYSVVFDRNNSVTLGFDASCC